MSSKTLLFILSTSLTFLPSTLALVFPGPNPTDSPSSSNPSTLAEQGWTPKPTNPPNLELELFKKNVLQPRQLSSNTCGFVDGNEADAITCAYADAQCAYNVASEYFACCTSLGADGYFSGDCLANTPPATCYDYTSADLCTGTCADDNFVCGSSLSLCTTALLTGTDDLDSITYTHYGCDTTRTVMQLLPSWTTSVDDSNDTQVSPVPTVNSSPSRSAGSSATSSTHTNPPSVSTASRTYTPTTSATSSTTTSASPTPQPKSNTGPIVGGVVGVLGGLALVAGGVIFWLRKRKINERKSVVPEVSHTPYIADQK